MIRSALGAILLLAGAVPAAAQTAPPSPRAADGHLADPPRFPAVSELVQALGIEEQAARIVDTHWDPAGAMLAAANPARAEAARAFVAARRDRELAIYPRLVVMSLDHSAVRLLNPKVERQLDVLGERRSADYARTRDVSDAKLRKFAQERSRIEGPAAARANGDLLELARLARTPEGLALRDLQRRGYYWCDLVVRERPANRGDDALCKDLEASPVLKRLGGSRSGARLVRLSSAAHGSLIALVQMGHAAGFSLHGLLPPDELRAAGLAVPPDQIVQPKSFGQDVPPTPDAPAR